MPLPYLILYAEYEEDIMEAERRRLQWAIIEVLGDQQEVKKMRAKMNRGRR